MRVKRYHSAVTGYLANRDGRNLSNETSPRLNLVVNPGHLEYRNSEERGNFLGLAFVRQEQASAVWLLVNIVASLFIGNPLAIAGLMRQTDRLWQAKAPTAGQHHVPHLLSADQVAGGNVEWLDPVAGA